MRFLIIVKKQSSVIWNGEGKGLKRFSKILKNPPLGKTNLPGFVRAERVN
jgi:hypothetical protein